VVHLVEEEEKKGRRSRKRRRRRRRRPVKGCSYMYNVGNHSPSDTPFISEDLKN
jgi:hypothetical protein